MKIRKLILITCLAVCFSQASADAQIKFYKSWITLNKAPNSAKEALFEVKGSSIVFSNSWVLKDYARREYTLNEYPVTQIEMLKIRKKGNIAVGIGIGAVVGFTTGYLIGNATGEDTQCNSNTFVCFDLYSKEESALIGGVSGTLIGAGIGALIGSIKLKIPLNGNMETYQNNIDKLKKRAIKKR